MTTLQAIVLGAVQGITEFLPVSSSGHLQLAKELLDVHMTDNLTFDVALHAGTVLSTLLVLWSEISLLLKQFFSRRLNDAHRYMLKIVISMIPIGVVGFTLKDELDAMLSSHYVLLVVGAMLLLTALLLGFAHFYKRTNSIVGREVGYLDSFVIGLAQMMAVMPGLSRSGSTIATGILLGCGRSAVAKFSFLMVLAPILGSMLLDIVKGGGEFVVDGVSGGVVFAGFFSAFVVGVIACRAMIEIVKRGKLIYFSAYCLLAGVAAIAGYFLKY